MPYRTFVALAGFALSGVVAAAIPETGVYWNPRESGKGYYIERQGNTVFVGAYAYRADGSPVFYVGSATINENSPGPPDYELLHPIGQAVHSAFVDLYESSGGVCLACEGTGNQLEKRGRIGLWWVHSAQPTVEILLDGVHHQPFELRRFNFALPGIGTTGAFSRSPDMIGEWVFTEVTDPEAVPWRFRFNRRVDLSINDPVDVIFHDDSRGAQFHCRAGRLPVHVSGCELLQDGAVLFSANIGDVGLSRIQAYRGDLLPNTGLVGRRAETVIGYRVEY